MLITDPALRATLAEILSLPWMVRGFNGPPDPHLLHREPLRADELDRQVIRGMTGFEFGSEQDIEKNLVTILESEEYIRAVQHWKKKRSIGSRLDGHGKEGSRWGDLSNSSLSLSFDGNTSGRGDPSTPSKTTKGFFGFDFYRRKGMSTPPDTPKAYSPSNSQNPLSHPSMNEPNREPLDPTHGRSDPPTLSKKTKNFSGFDFYRRKRTMSPPPASPTVYSPSNSQNHISHPPPNESNREPLDPTSGYHPLLSMYYLARERLERERVYGPGRFASSHVSILDPSGAASPEGPSVGRSSSTSGMNIHIKRSFAKREKELPPLAGGKAGALPGIIAPSTPPYSGMSYDNMIANNQSSGLSLRGRYKADAKKEEDAREKETELLRKEDEAWKKEREAKRKEQEVRRKEEEAKEKEDLRKKYGEVRKRETEVRKYEKEVREHEDEVRKHAGEVRKHDEEVKKHDEEVKKREEEVRKCEEEVRKREEEVRKHEEEVRKRAEEAQQKELEARQKNDVDMVCARLFILLQAPESFKKLVCLQEHQAQEMMDLLQKVRLSFMVPYHVHLTHLCDYLC